MSEQNSEVADIQERIMKGEKNAVGNLQKLSNSPKIKSNKAAGYYQPNQQISSQSVQDLSNAKKNQNFRKYLKQKVSQMRVGKNEPIKQLSKLNNQDIKPYAQPKPFPKTFKRTQVKSQQKATHIENTKQTKIIAPSVEKLKTVSNNFQKKINKNIVKGAQTQKASKQSPPSSKQSFRIRMQAGNNKKLLEQLMKLNQEQRQLQSQILHLHTDTKQQLAQIFQKYNIKTLDKSYVQIKENPPSDRQMENFDSPNRLQINIVKQKSVFIKGEEEKLQKLKRQILQLNTEIETKKNQIFKKQAKIDGLPLITYMNSVPDIFEERQSQEEAQQIQQLPNNDLKKTDPTKTYQNLMVEKRKRNWGLQKRVNYQYQNIKNNESGKQNLDKSSEKNQIVAQKIQDGDNIKIVVNPRLKQFLFE